MGFFVAVRFSFDVVLVGCSARDVVTMKYSRIEVDRRLIALSCAAASVFAAFGFTSVERIAELLARNDRPHSE